MSSSTMFLMIVLIASCETSRGAPPERTREDKFAGDGSQAPSVSPREDVNTEYHASEMFRHENMSKGVIGLLKLRPAVPKESMDEFDNAIRRIMVSACGMHPGDKRAYEQLMQSSIEEFFPLQVLGDAKSIGCGVLITTDGHKHSGVRAIDKTSL